jgi:hypothetical protein
MQLDNFKKAAAMASATSKAESPIIPVLTKKPATNGGVKKVTPVVKVVPVDPKKRAASGEAEEAPETKRAKLTETTDATIATNSASSGSTGGGLVKYKKRRDEDDE